MKGEIIDSHDHVPATFDNPEMFAKKFDSAERDGWQKPDEVMKAFNLPSNAVVVEIGAGTGYFTVRLAAYLKDGKVIALDTSSKMVEYLKKRIYRLGLPNVAVRLSESHDEMHVPEKVDLILCVDTYHHIANRASYFGHLLPYLKQDGKIVIIDRPIGSPESLSLAHRTPPEVVKKEMEQAGFELIEELALLLPYQFYLAFKSVGFSQK